MGSISRMRSNGEKKATTSHVNDEFETEQSVEPIVSYYAATSLETFNTITITHPIILNTSLSEQITQAV